jgi:hypothetical protein
VPALKAARKVIQDGDGQCALADLPGAVDDDHPGVGQRLEHQG